MTRHTVLRQNILSDMETIANDERLLCEKNFILRSQAMDDIEFHVIDRIQFLAEREGTVHLLNDLKEQAGKLRTEWEDVNAKMFKRLRIEISEGGCRGESFRNLLNEYIGQQPAPEAGEPGYDHLDLLLNGLLMHRTLPAETGKREPGMIYYQKTPARIIFELIKKADLKSGDVFFDLGSGLGQVVMLVNLLTSVPSRGVEFEPAYCEYAKSIAAKLNLQDIEFIHADARGADYSSGTVFFMYTPFEGQILRDVLQNLHGEAEKRKIRIFTYGSCTSEVENQLWLRQVGVIQNSGVELAEFESV